MAVTIVGLGPGGARYLTKEAWDLLSAVDQIYARTENHPAIGELPRTVNVHSFDHFYQSADTFGDVYKQIVQELIRLAAQGDIVYAVPGHPHVGEATVPRLLRAAKEAQLSVRVITGISFIEPVLTALNIDALDGLQIDDALALVDYVYPAVNTDTPLLLGQVYNRLIAGEVKQVLGALYPDEHPVILVHHAGEEDETIERLALYEIDRSDQIDHLTALFVPPLPLKSSLSALAETVAVLRSPDGCPWDIEQTPQSMRSGFLEEAYEVLDAIDRDDQQNLREELGDLLYHIVMQAQMAAENEEFTLSQVIAGIEEKLRRRHPHVWGNWQVDNTEQVLENWEQLKQVEKPERSSDSMLDGLLKSLPALSLSQKIQNRVGRAGFDWPEIDGIFEKIEEEIGELKSAQSAAEQQAEMGDLLFIMVNLARHYGVDAQNALREANARFESRFRIVESIARERGLVFQNMTLSAMDDLWDEAKGALAKDEGRR